MAAIEMGFVGGKWLKFGYIPSIEGLSSLFSDIPAYAKDYHHGIRGSDLLEILIADWEAVLQNPKELILWKIASDLPKIKFVQIGEVSVIRTDQPLINLQSNGLCFRSPDLLTANCASGQNCYLQLSYPETIFRHGSGTRESMVESPEYTLYRRIRHDVFGTTKPLVVCGPEREWRLPIRIEPSMKAWLARTPLFQEKNLRIK